MSKHTFFYTVYKKLLLSVKNTKTGTCTKVFWYYNNYQKYHSNDCLFQHAIFTKSFF